MIKLYRYNAREEMLEERKLKGRLCYKDTPPVIEVKIPSRPSCGNVSCKVETYIEIPFDDLGEMMAKWGKK